MTLTFLVPAMAGGAPYVWCVGMHRAQMTCCCHGRHGATAARADVRRGLHDDAIASLCCVGHRVDSAPTASDALDSPLVVAPPAAVAWLTLVELLPVTTEAPQPVRHREQREARAGPTVLLFALDCAYLN